MLKINEAQQFLNAKSTYCRISTYVIDELLHYESTHKHELELGRGIKETITGLFSNDLSYNR